ncbi:peptidase M22 glycoprotease [Thermodesulfobium narugense DSM 14796]|uniref:Peptidase M22 glycoprotease n=1 Tax=Thermodesulfobium narugense DSM 14796 TaxID=747365 RepID=M1E4A9_9BACT|nr:peptidase M22 glycoprotease [Thermodesulfobium narugense]AEE13922.1 peptidase M22 glycoprotease [Thermodesulfobium narugense DSM 14796]
MNRKNKFFIAHINDETYFLLDNGENIKDYSFKGHLSDQLHLKFKQFLDLYGFNLNDIDSIYVSRGPGSFTALRTVILFAKTLCLCLRTKLFSANIFEIFLYGTDSSKEIQNIALFSKKNSYYLAKVVSTKGLCGYNLVAEEKLNDLCGLFIGNNPFKNFKSVSFKDIKINFNVFREEDVYSFEPEYGIDLNVKVFSR